MTDYTSALDKITTDGAAGSAAGGSTAQDYLSSSAQAASDKARELKDAAAQAFSGSSGGQTAPSSGNVTEQTKSTMQVHTVTSGLAPCELHLFRIRCLTMLGIVILNDILLQPPGDQ